MSKYRIVEFTDGTFGLEKMWFFNLLGSGDFLVDNNWVLAPLYHFKMTIHIYSYCRFVTIQDAICKLSSIDNRHNRKEFGVLRVIKNE